MRPDQMPRQPFPASELDALPESVKAAYRMLEAFVAYNTRPNGSNVFEEFPFQVDAARIVLARVRELERENGELRKLRDGVRISTPTTTMEAECVAYAHPFKDRAERAESELAAIKKRIAEAPVITGDECGLEVIAPGWNGVRVALLALDDEAKA